MQENLENFNPAIILEIERQYREEIIDLKVALENETKNQKDLAEKFDCNEKFWN